MPSTRRIDVCYEIHPGEDLHDGITYEMFLERVNNHPRCDVLRIPATCCCSNSTTCSSSTSIIRASDVSRQGRRVQPERPAGRMFRVPAMGKSRWAFPVAGRRAGGVRRDLFQAVAIRVRRLGGARMGVLLGQREQGAAEGASLSRRTSSRLPPGPSTTRSKRHRPGGQPQALGAQLMAERIRLGMVGGSQGAFILWAG